MSKKHPSSVGLTRLLGMIGLSWIDLVGIQLPNNSCLGKVKQPLLRIPFETTEHSMVVLFTITVKPSTGV